MTVTQFPAVLLRSCLIRDGVWLIDAKHSAPTDFYHRTCFGSLFQARQMPVKPTTH